MNPSLKFNCIQYLFLTLLILTGRLDEHGKICSNEVSGSIIAKLAVK